MLVYILFIIGFVLLVKGADLLVEGASSIAKKLRISELVIGLTIVAFGTSFPEFIVNIFATVQGSSGIAVGNVLGSNIANILLILGLSAIIYPLTVRHKTVWKEIPFALLAAITVGVLASDRLIDDATVSMLTRIDGVILMLFFLIFLYYIYETIKKDHKDDTSSMVSTQGYSSLKSFVLIIGGLVLLNVGAKWVVDGGISLAEDLSVSESLVGVTLVALGTSLPELATSTMAAYKRNTDIAIGNIVGSNIFNIFLILGVSAIIHPLPFSGVNTVDIGVGILAPLLLFVVMFTGHKRNLLERWEGLVFLILYSGYIAFVIVHG